MKTIYVFFVCFVAVALATRTAEEDAREDAEEAELFNQCKKELGIPESTEIKESLEGVAEEKRPCMYFCIFKKLELMNEDGSYNTKAFVDGTLVTKREMVKMTIENCEKNTKPADGCKLAACLMAAARAHNAESKDDKDGKGVNFF